MRITVIRYSIFTVLLGIVMFFGFEAVREGVREGVKEDETQIYEFPSQKTKDTKVKNKEVQRDATRDQVKEKSEEKKEEKKEEGKKLQDASKEKEVLETEEENPGVSRLHSSDTFIYVLPLDKEEKNRKENSRKKTLPEFSKLYAPVFSGSQLSQEALYGFLFSFPGKNPSGKIFLLEKEISHSAKGSRYQVLIYDKTGKQFLGSFETVESQHFPMRATPMFIEVGDQQFKKSSRFFIISDSDQDLFSLLNHEPYLQSILKSAYHSTLDSQAFLGTDKNFNVNVYAIFPGIFVASLL